MIATLQCALDWGIPTSKETLYTLKRGATELLSLLGDIVDSRRSLLLGSGTAGGGAGKLATLTGDGANCC